MIYAQDYSFGNVIAKHQKQTKIPSTGEWLNVLQYVDKMKYHVILEKKRWNSLFTYMNSSTKYKLEKQNSDESIGYFLMYKRKLRL